VDIKIQAIGKFFPLPKEYPAVSSYINSTTFFERRKLTLIYQIIGSDITSEIFEVGEGVAGFKKGDRVVA
jgi:threonine dehydrogenase-like Zn-dependent dehydrogenase